MSKLFRLFFSHFNGHTKINESQSKAGLDNLAKDALLKGKTLLIYKYMIKRGRPIGPREL